MYIVQWCDHEGKLRTRRFSRLEDACEEEEYLIHHYDGVEILDEDTGEPIDL